MFMVLVDAHSKWLEVHKMPSITSFYTIEKLREIFATHGLPQILVSDNATTFTSAEFKRFMDCNGIRHITSARTIRILMDWRKGLSKHLSKV